MQKVSNITFFSCAHPIWPKSRLLPMPVLVSLSRSLPAGRSRIGWECSENNTLFWGQFFRAVGDRDHERQCRYRGAGLTWCREAGKEKVGEDEGRQSLGLCCQCPPRAGSRGAWPGTLPSSNSEHRFLRAGTGVWGELAFHPQGLSEPGMWVPPWRTPSQRLPEFSS